MQVDRLCIVGAGTMGTGIAQVAAQAGLRVCLVDTGDEALSRSRVALDRSLQGAVEREKLTPAQAEQVRRLITWTEEMAALREADWVIEAVFEDRGVKEQVLGEIGRAARPEVPIATNTSTFPISELARASGRPERFLGLHFFNPPPAMKLVEVVAGPETLPEAVQAGMELCERVGKTPLPVPDIPGFVVNRVFGALVAAAIDAWERGAEAQVVDAAIELGLGHRMGPLKTADLVGLDVMLALLESLSAQTGHGRFEVPPRLAKLVAEGKLGRKAGEGFYRY